MSSPQALITVKSWIGAITDIGLMLLALAAARSLALSPPTLSDFYTKWTRVAY